MLEFEPRSALALLGVRSWMKKPPFRGSNRGITRSHDHALSLAGSPHPALLGRLKYAPCDSGYMTLTSASREQVNWNLQFLSLLPLAASFLPGGCPGFRLRLSGSNGTCLTAPAAPLVVDIFRKSRRDVGIQQPPPGPIKVSLRATTLLQESAPLDARLVNRLQQFSHWS